MQDSFVAEATHAGVAMDNFNLLTYDDIAKNGEEGEDRWEGRFTVNDEEGDMIDLETVCEVAHSSPAFVGVSYDNYFVTAVDEFLRAVRR